METDAQPLEDLLQLSRALGQPEAGYVILGEGNTAAAADADTFYVKASGFSLHGIGAEGFVRVAYAPLFAAMDGDLDDGGVAAVLQAAKADPEAPRPSVETFLHAVALREGGAKFVGHTHPVAVNQVLCSNLAEVAVGGRLFPDEIVSCGVRSLYMPYCDPGLTLARAFRAAFCRYLDVEGQAPKVVLIQNHGLIVLGASAKDVLATSAMTVKAFQVLWGTYALGGPRFLTEAQVARISGRPDEHYRRSLINR